MRSFLNLSDVSHAWEFLFLGLLGSCDFDVLKEFSAFAFFALSCLRVRVEM